MGAGIAILFISSVWALILLVRVDSIFGQKFLIISGDILGRNANIVALSDVTYIFLWLIALGGFCFGLWLIISSSKTKSDSFTLTENNSEESFRVLYDEKKCPICAEKIKLEALKCKHCGEVFKPKDISIERERRESERDEKVIRDAYKVIKDQKGDAFCFNCRSTSPINGMYHHRSTDTYYHEKCLPQEILMLLENKKV